MRQWKRTGWAIGLALLVWLVGDTLSAKAEASAAVTSAVYLLEMDGSGEFIHFPANDYMFKNTNGGRHPELQRAMALATLGRALAEGDRTPSVVDTYTAVVKKVMSDPNHMPDIDCGLDARQQNSFIAALALGWKQADIMAGFSTTERERIEAFAEAGVVSCAYVYASYMEDGTVRASGRRVSMDGDTNVYSSPNYAESIMGMFLSSSLIVGLENVPSLLNSYDHASFLTKLNNLGLTDVYDNFAKTFTATISPIVYDASDAAKKAALVEGIVQAIAWNDGQGRPFWRGLTLAQLVGDPVALYAQLAQTTYTEAATEGDYIGRVGRGHEFNTGDSGGIRDDLSYTAVALPNSYMSRYLLSYYGYWQASAQTAVKNDIGNRLLVGASDIQGKAYNGYWSYSRGHATHESLVQNTTWYYPYTEDLAQSLGLMKSMKFNENFEAGVPAGWSTTGSWTASSEPTWSGSTTELETVLVSNSLSGSSVAAATYAGGDYDYYVPLKVEQWGSGSDRKAGLIGRYADSSHYYAMVYSQAAQKLQIVRVNGSSTQTLAEKAYTLDLGKVYQLKGTFAGASLKLYVGGVLQLEATDTTFTSGAVGLLSSGVVAKFDDIYATNTASLKPMPPRVPAQLQADVVSGSVYLAWEADPEAVSYTILRSTQVGGPYTAIGTSTTPAYADHSVSDNTYYYVVQATNAIGDSGLSEEVTASLLLTVPAAADATVRGGSYASTNYGASKSLDIKASSSANYYRELYIKFDLSAVTAASIGSARLKLYAASNDPLTASVPLSVYSVQDDQWTESGLTFGTKPSALQLLDTVSYSGSGQYISWDITDFVAAELSGDRIVTLLVKDATGSDKSIGFRSRENTSNKPVLELGLSVPAEE